MNKIKRESTLWHWICTRLISLAVGSVILIAFCMWLRFYVQNKWYELSMPESVRDELAKLAQNPYVNINRYHEIIDTWYGIAYSDPSLVTTDWLILVALVLIVTPFIFILTLKSVRPISKHIIKLESAATAVAEGKFGSTIAVPAHLPLELQSLTENLNGMSLQLHRYEKELKQSHVALVHELRSPLTAATGRLQGMIDGVFEPSEVQLNMVMQQLVELNRLVEDLHLLKLADAGQLRLELMSASVNEIIREKIAWANPTARKVGLQITHNEEYINCLVDPYRIGQVFTILIDNALRYAVDGGYLGISYEISEDNVCVLFKDKGPAVTDEFMKRMFSPFVREDISRSRHFGGSGLGLSIAKAICEAHGGGIDVMKNPEEGLTFKVLLGKNVNVP